MNDFDLAYKDWLKNIKELVRTSQIKAVVSVNSELLDLYWNLGKMIIEKEQNSNWGSKVIEKLSKDLSSEFVEIKGFSRQNLYYVRQWYLFYNQDHEIVQQLVGQFHGNSLVNKFDIKNIGFSPILKLIPWGHHILLLSKCKDLHEAFFYVVETIQNNWSRSVLKLQIESNLYRRQGKALTNFEVTLPKPQADLARDLFKNPYNFDFISLGKEIQERDVEDALVNQITKFLLELDRGFAYMGRQYEINVGGDDYRIDLLFYNVFLRCFVVIELKIDSFKPEYLGKLSFYLTSIDNLLKTEQDKPTIGLLLCKIDNKITAEWALKDTNKPLGIAEYKINDEMPAELLHTLPTIDEIERKLEVIIFKDNDKGIDLNFPVITLINTEVSNKINEYLQSEILIIFDTIESGANEEISLEKALELSSYTKKGIYSEISYKVLLETKKLLSIALFCETITAYPSTHNYYFIFDLATGVPINLDNIFTEQGKSLLYLDILHKKQENINNHFEGLRTKPKSKKLLKDMEDAFESYDCKNKVRLNNYFLESNKITFIENCEFPHVIKALDLDTKIEYIFEQLGNYLSPYGKELLEIENKAKT